MYTRAHNEAQKEADDQAWSAEYSKNEEQQQPQEEPEPIPTAATVILSTQLHRAGNKGDRELHYEDIMRNLFESYGYKPPEQEARCGEAKRVKLAPAPKLFPVLYERLVFLALSRDVPEDKGYLRLRRLGCDAGMLRAELEALTSAPLELVQAMTPGEDHMVGDSSCYKLLTAYLMFSSLRPEQVWRVVELATEVGKRDAERDDCQRALLEFFCFLGLWMELWEAQAGMMRLPQGMALPVSVLQEQSRRVLIASLRECLEVKFAPAKPFMGVETPVEQQFPSQGGAGQAMTGQRSHSINNYRSAVPQRNHSWEMGSDASYGPPSTMPTGYDGNTPVWEPPMSTLTEEQKSIVNTDIGEGELMKVRAYAGTGKTRSLVEFAKQRPLKRFLYVAFNKSAETDAKAKFGHNVDCRLTI